jgi:GDPmannose 4,6-dehydratase
MYRKTALIFGAAGQDGWYLSRLLERNGLRVVESSRSHPSVPCDVSDRSRVDELVRSTKPDYIFNLAASSSTRHEVVFENQRSILDGALNILEAVRCYASGAKTFFAGSALQFQNSGQPIDESTPFFAGSAYSAQRIGSVYMARYFRDAYGVDAYVGYFFHHDSPRRASHHVAQKVAMAARAIRSGNLRRLEMGCLDVSKEWTFAGDSMEAVWRLVNQDVHHEVVIGSGEAHSIRDWVDACFGRLGLETEEFVVEDKSYVPEYRRVVSNPARLRSIGWSASVSFSDLAGMMVGDVTSD